MHTEFKAFLALHGDPSPSGQKGGEPSNLGGAGGGSSGMDELD